MHPDLVYDVGVNNGDDSEYYLRSGYRVVGIEADPLSAAGLKKRFTAEIAAGRFTLLDVCVGPQSGTMTFYVSKGNRGVWSSLDSSYAEREGLTAEPVEVRCVRFDEILSDYGVPYYLKVDIEGADHYCLSALDPADLPKFLSFEATPGRICDLYGVHRLGYASFKLIDQMNGFRQALPPSLHSLDLARAILKEQFKRGFRGIGPLYSWARKVNRKSLSPPTSEFDEAFPISSSGPMGDETDGDWRNVEEVAYAWMYFLQRTHVSNWYDVHACL